MVYIKEPRSTVDTWALKYPTYRYFCLTFPIIFSSVCAVRYFAYCTGVVSGMFVH